MDKIKILLRMLWLATSIGAIGLHAQTSQVSGQVADPAKEAIGKARVVLTRTDTGDRRETLTSAEGYYSFPLVSPGSYELQVEKEGFQTLTRTGIRVETGQVSTVDVSLEVGAVSQSINVEANAPQLQTDSGAVSNVVENKTIVDMPLIDRRSSQLQRLSGFVVQSGTGANATFAIAGGRGNNANYLIDGGTAQNLLLGVETLSFDPPIESVQEFNVAISNYAAELGRTGGAVIQMTTRSGTNDFHGSAYEFFRNDVLNARTFFAQNIPALRYNLFGSSLGGPIKKNKTQFFFNYEGRRQVTSTTEVLNVPSAAEVQGNFSADSTKVTDPTTGVQFPGNIIPQSRLDAVGAKLAAFYPVPNVAGAQPGKANFVANDPAYTPVDVYVARIDHTISDKDRIFGRLLAQTDHTTTASIFPVAGTDSFSNLTHDYYYNGSGTWFHNFSPTVINEARYTYTRRQYLYISAGANTNIDSEIGLTGVNQAYFPTVTVNGYTQLGNSQQERLQTPIRSDQYVDNITWIRGSHQFKAGVEFRNSKNEDRYYPSAGGAFTFTNQSTGSSLASLLLGRVYSATILATEPLNTRAASVGAFFQDDWHVTPSLTLNLGLRYDVDEPRWEENNRQNGFDPTAINPVSGTPGVITFSGRNGVSKYANNWDLHNFGPHIGFAWKPADHWVIRGGGAIIYLPEYDQATPIVANTGFSISGNFVSPNNGVTPAFLLSNGMPPASAPTEAQLTPGFGAVAVGQKPTTTITYFNPNRVNGYLYQTSFDIQRQLKGNILVDVGYLGTFGHHLPAPDPQSIDQVPTNLLGPGNTQVLRPYPQYSNVQIIAPDIGSSNYHGLNVGVNKRYSIGLQLQANYTFSKMIDNVDSRNELAAYPGNDAFTNYYNQANDRGLSGNDIRRRFIASFTYDLPVGRGRVLVPSSKILNTFIGGWTVGAIAELHSGTPLSPIELTNNTNSFSDGVRPNVVGNPAISGDRSKAAQLAEWFNVNAFAAPAPYTFGDAGRTFGEGPGFANLDTSLLKNFALSERFVLQFRAEGLNVLNHANFANPNTQQGSPTFGQVTSLVSGNQARIIQLGLHLQF
ncbi:MAG: TonB-dependent receptor [Bryobacteraceae bacterium]